jgi:hypothetical protein
MSLRSGDLRLKQSPAETMIHLDKEIASGNPENYRGKRARVPSQ